MGQRLVFAGRRPLRWLLIRVPLSGLEKESTLESSCSSCVGGGESVASGDDGDALSSRDDGRRMSARSSCFCGLVRVPS